MSEKLRGEEIYLEKTSSNFESAYDEVKASEEKREIESISRRMKIFSRYKQMLFSDPDHPREELTEEEKRQLTQELEELDTEYTENGMHFGKCQFYKIIDALRLGRKVEIEGFGPYLRDYLETGLTDEQTKLTTDDEKGIAAMEILFEYFPEAHAASLADAYNTWKFNYETGTPRELLGYEDNKDKIHTDVSESYKKRFKLWVERVLRSRGIIRPDEKEDYDNGFVINEESELVEGAKKLTSHLVDKGFIEGNTDSDTGEIWFIQTATQSEDPRYTRIKLRDANGHWECAALDASQFMHPRNLDITHVIILPRSNFEQQQDQVWEIVRKINPDADREGFRGENIHNIFIDTDNEKVTIELIKETLRKKLGVFKQ